METTPSSLPHGLQIAGPLRGLPAWLRMHPGAVMMAGLLAFAAPINFFFGSISLMREPSAADVTAVGLWWLLYGGQLWIMLLAAGQLGAHWSEGAGRIARGAIWLALACVCAVTANVTTGGRAAILIEQGVVQGALTMELYGSTLSATLALLYFAHLRRSRTHEAAAARLVAAQSAQRETRRRAVQMRLQAVQARIDPALLFGLLESVRLAYVADPLRAERLLDELIAFLHASLPRLRTESSSVPREAELARAYVRLVSLADVAEHAMTLEISDAAMHARFPPGALLPLLADVLRSAGGDCELAAVRVHDACVLTLSVPAAPSDGASTRVRTLLEDLHGSLGGLATEQSGGRTLVKLRVPYEPA
jgi:hypothetical protein